MTTLALILSVSATAAEWTEPMEVRMRRDHVLTYRALLAGDTLIVEAAHEEGWHSYAMDNIERVREASGKAKPECELPTRIEVSGALTVTGPWRQTEPIDLSDTDIKWFTYGFEGTVYFAATVKCEAEGDATIRIDAQACDESKCRMVDGLELTLPVSAAAASVKPPIDLDSLVEVYVKPDDE